MKFLTVATFAAVAVAFPQQDGSTPKSVSPPKGSSGAVKGGMGGGSVSNELLEGSCKPIILIFARASTEPGNMGGSMGPIVCSGLKRAYPDKVACQGVGKPYTAGLADNVGTVGTTQAAIGEATKMFTTADSKCPDSIIVFGGYSQGTAVMMNTVKALPPNIKKKVVAGVLFGYTKNKQMQGAIPNYPKDQLTVFCDESSPGVYKDGVCGGQLNVNGGHFAYMTNSDGTKAVTFLKSKIDAGKGVS